MTGVGGIVCWGVTPVWPPGRYAAVSTGGSHDCALTEDGAAVCQSYFAGNEFGKLDAPPGRYVAISSGFGIGHGANPANSCALTEDGEVVCWGYGFDGSQWLEGPFMAVSAGGHFRLRPDHGRQDGLSVRRLRHG